MHSIITARCASVALILPLNYIWNTRGIQKSHSLNVSSIILPIFNFRKVRGDPVGATQKTLSVSFASLWINVISWQQVISLIIIMIQIFTEEGLSHSKVLFMRVLYNIRESNDIIIYHVMSNIEWYQMISYVILWQQVISNDIIIYHVMSNIVLYQIISSIILWEQVIYHDIMMYHVMSNIAWYQMRSNVMPWQQVISNDIIIYHVISNIAWYQIISNVIP